MAPSHEHVWRDTGFADVEDCACGAVKSPESAVGAADRVRQALDAYESTRLASDYNVDILWDHSRSPFPLTVSDLRALVHPPLSADSAPNPPVDNCNPSG